MGGNVLLGSLRKLIGMMMKRLIMAVSIDLEIDYEMELCLILNTGKVPGAPNAKERASRKRKGVEPPDAAILDSDEDEDEDADEVTRHTTGRKKIKMSKRTRYSNIFHT